MEHQLIIPFEDVDLAATLHYPVDKGAANNKCQNRWPLIIICHGFVGSRIGVDRLFVKAARELSAVGYMVLRFDYGGCGESTGDYGAGGLDVLIQQTQRIIDYSLTLDCVDPGRVILLGHSLGGAVSILTAARDKRVKTLVLWSPVAYPLNDLVRITGTKLRREAEVTGVADYLGYGLTSRFFHSLGEYNPLQETRHFTGDVLVAHGTADEVIPTEYCFVYQRTFWLREEGQCDKEVILNGDHTFSSSATFEELIGKTKDWLTYLEKRKTDWNHWVI